MIGNHEMEVDPIDPPFPLLLPSEAPQETFIIKEAADTSVVILDSPTPVRATKKRKISMPAADQSKNEDDSSGKTMEDCFFA